MSDSNRMGDTPSDAAAGVRNFGDAPVQAGSGRDRSGDERREPERDFGDSAGYGSGGSTRDYRDVVGDDESRRPRRPNPLDAVMTTGPGRMPARRGPPVERTPSFEIAFAAIALLTGSLGVLAWRGARSERERRRRQAMQRRGTAREDLARLQV